MVFDVASDKFDSECTAEFALIIVLILVALRIAQMLSLARDEVDNFDFKKRTVSSMLGGDLYFVAASLLFPKIIPKTVSFDF
jgi:hypothetical protein